MDFLQLVLKEVGHYLAKLFFLYYQDDLIENRHMLKLQSLATNFNAINFVSMRIYELLFHIRVFIDTVVKENLVHDRLLLDFEPADSR